MQAFGYSLRELADMGPLGLSSIYKALNAGTLKGKKYGDKTIVTPEEYRRFLDSLPNYPAKPDQAA